MAGCIAVAVRDFHVEHIVHVATHGVIGFDDFRCGLLARAAIDKEEIDEHILAAVEDVEQVDFGAVAVSSREVNGLREWALRFQAKTKGQREEKGKEFFQCVLN